MSCRCLNVAKLQSCSRGPERGTDGLRTHSKVVLSPGFLLSLLSPHSTPGPPSLAFGARREIILPWQGEAVPEPGNQLMSFAVWPWQLFPWIRGLTLTRPGSRGRSGGLVIVQCFSVDRALSHQPSLVVLSSASHSRVQFICLFRAIVYDLQH